MNLGDLNMNRILIINLLSLFSVVNKPAVLNVFPTVLNIST